MTLLLGQGVAPLDVETTLYGNELAVSTVSAVATISAVAAVSTIAFVRFVLFALFPKPTVARMAENTSTSLNTRLHSHIR